MNERERLQFTKDLIAAIEEAQTASQQPKSPAVLATEAYKKLQFDFPLVSVEELDALTAQYQSSTGGPKLTNKYIDVVYEGAAPTVINPEQETQQSNTPTSDPLRIAFQKLYAVSLLTTVRQALTSPQIQQNVALLDEVHIPQYLPEIHNDNEDDSTETTATSTATAATDVDIWQTTILPKLTLIIRSLKYQCLDEATTWSTTKLIDLLCQCVSTIRSHANFLQLDGVAEPLCGLLHDHIAAHPIDLDGVSALLKALQIPSTASSLASKDTSSFSQKMNEESAAAARLGIQVVASLASRLKTTSAQRKLWQLTHDGLIVLAASLLEWQENQQRLRKKKSSSVGATKKTEPNKATDEKKTNTEQEQLEEEQAQFDAVQLSDAALASTLVAFYILQAPAKTDNSDTLLKTGLYRSLVLVFIQQGSQQGAEPIHHALRLAAAAAPNLVEWADAVPGFTAVLSQPEFDHAEGVYRLHAAVWSALKGGSGGGDVLLSELIQQPLTVHRMPALHRMLTLLAEIHAAAKTRSPWGSATNSALKNLGLQLRQGFKEDNMQLTPQSVDGEGDISKSDNNSQVEPSTAAASEPVKIEEILQNGDVQSLEEEEAEDIRKMQIPAEQREEVLLLRQARQLQPDCLRLLKGLLQAPGVSGKGD